MNAPLHREIPMSAFLPAAALDLSSAQWDADIVGQLTPYLGG